MSIIKNLGILAVFCFVSQSFASANPANPMNSPIYYDEMEPTIEDLQAARIAVEEFGLDKSAKIRMNLDQIAVSSRDQFYIKVEACLLYDLKTCTRLGASYAFTTGDEGTTIMNLKFANMTSFKAHQLSQLLETKDVVVLMTSVYQKQPWYFRDVLVSKSYVSFEKLFERTPITTLVTPELGLVTTVQYLR